MSVSDPYDFLVPVTVSKAAKPGILTRVADAFTGPVTTHTTPGPNGIRAMHEHRAGGLLLKEKTTLRSWDKAGRKSKKTAGGGITREGKLFGAGLAVPVVAEVDRRNRKVKKMDEIFGKQDDTGLDIRLKSDIEKAYAVNAAGAATKTPTALVRSGKAKSKLPAKAEQFKAGYKGYTAHDASRANRAGVHVGRNKVAYGAGAAGVGVGGTYMAVKKSDSGVSAFGIEH
jgi:hypothetical protein